MTTSTHPTVEYVHHVHVPALTHTRVQTILTTTEHPTTDPVLAERHALEAAQRAGRSVDVIRNSEHLRRSVWGVVWDKSCWADAWTISWVLARVGIGLATVDLIDGHHYSVSDYLALVTPWTDAFPEHPIPRDTP